MGVGDREVKERTEKPAIEDPREYFENFCQSTLYEEGYKQRLAKFESGSGASKERIREVFNESDEVKDVFFNYAQDEISFHYNPDLFPEESRKAISNYIETVGGYRDVFKNLGPDTKENQEIIQYVDRERSKAHENAAFVLWSEKIAPSKRLGKALVSLILIEKGLETFANALERDIRRAQRKIGIAGY